MNMNRIFSSIIWAIPFGVAIGVGTKDLWMGLAITLAFSWVTYNKKVKQKTGC
jgi:hypothetical protein